MRTRSEQANAACDRCWREYLEASDRDKPSAYRRYQESLAELGRVWKQADAEEEAATAASLGAEDELEMARRQS